MARGNIQRRTPRLGNDRTNPYRENSPCIDGKQLRSLSGWALDDFGYLGRGFDLHRPFSGRAEKGAIVPSPRPIIVRSTWPTPNHAPRYAHRERRWSRQALG